VDTPPPDALFTRQFWLACAVHFCGGMGISFYILFPLFIRHLGGTEVTIGLYAGLTGAAAVLARIPVGRFLDTLGRRRVLLSAGALHIAAWLGFLAFRSISLGSAAFVIPYGLAAGALFATYFTYASDIIPLTRRSEGFAMFGVWGMLPNGLGPWIGERLIAQHGFQVYFVVAACFALVSFGLSFFLPETARRGGLPPAATVERSGAFRSRELVVLLCGAFTFGLAVESVFVFLAPFSYAFGHGNVGFFFMTYACTAVAIRIISGRLPDRLGLRRVLIPALLAYSLGVAAIPYGDRPLWTALAVLCGAAHGYAFPILNALVVAQVPETYRGRAVSWLTAMFDLGHTVGNPVLGVIAHELSYRAMYRASGTVLLVTTILLWWRRPEPDSEAT
jgi:MFS family permease